MFVNLVSIYEIIKISYNKYMNFNNIVIMPVYSVVSNIDSTIELMNSLFL